MPIPQGLIDQDFRFNPVTRVFVPEDVTNEIKTCTQLSGLGGVFGFFLNELPLKETPSSVQVTRMSDNVVFSEVNTMPIGTQFFVDYHHPDKSNRGIIILPASQNGLQFKVQYKAIGGVVHKQNINALVQNYVNPIQTQVNNLSTQVNNLSTQVNNLSTWITNSGYSPIDANIVTASQSIINIPNAEVLVIDIRGTFNIDTHFAFLVGNPSYDLGNDTDGYKRVALNFNIVGGNTSTVNKIIFFIDCVVVRSFGFGSSFFRFHTRFYKNGSPLPYNSWTGIYKKDSIFSVNGIFPNETILVRGRCEQCILFYNYTLSKFIDEDVSTKIKTNVRF